MFYAPWSGAQPVVLRVGIWVFNESFFVRSLGAEGTDTRIHCPASRYRASALRGREKSQSPGYESNQIAGLPGEVPGLLPKCPVSGHTLQNAPCRRLHCRVRCDRWGGNHPCPGRLTVAASGFKSPHDVAPRQNRTTISTVFASVPESASPLASVRRGFRLRRGDQSH